MKLGLYILIINLNCPLPPALYEYYILNPFNFALLISFHSGKEKISLYSFYKSHYPPLKASYENASLFLALQALQNV